MDDIVIQKSQLQHELPRYLSREWLETNGLGGYASSSILNCHTRRYHGLLVAQLNQPAGKFVLLSQLEDELLLNNHYLPLTVFQYRGVCKSAALEYFTEFRQGICPSFSYQYDNIKLEKQIMLLDGSDTVLVQYQLTGSSHQSHIQLKIRPLLAMRDFHQLMQANAYVQAPIQNCKQGISITPYQGMPSLFFQANAPFSFTFQPCWYYQFEYQRELTRGFAGHEDLFSPGWFIINVDTLRPLIFSVSLQPEQQALQELWRQEQQRRRRLVQHINQTNHLSPLQQRLQFSATSFLRKTAHGQRSIVAGYPSFVDWGRDAMISVPGLTLINQQDHECLQVLRYFAQHQQEGLLPNFVGVGNEPNAYDAVDASLWFAWAVQQYYYATADLSSIQQHLWPTLCVIFDKFCQGTYFHIHLDDSGLIWAGGPLIKISWMDAVVDGVPVTSRYGYQVEVNALWYNFLGLIYELAVALKHPLASRCKSMLTTTKKAFQHTFCYAEGGYLYDFVNEKEHNTAIRPNQIFAVSLPYSPLNRQQALEVLRIVQQHLFTPYGLRTLSQDQSNYQGQYQGGPAQRDRAYHQGTVWPWLLGHFANGLLRYYNNEQVHKILAKSVEVFTLHLSEHGIGSIAEIFDGDIPQQAHGCISQAWSVAEILRMLSLLNTDDRKNRNHA